ncbi:MAG: tetratricopeptide repeat protein [Phycisphaerae bacterium]|nr:tetratricopeptide repeat protein [Phycisphaerae bacterium]
MIAYSLKPMILERPLNFNPRVMYGVALVLCVLVMLTGCRSGSRSGSGPSGQRGAAADANTEAYVAQAKELRTAGRDDEALALLTRAIEANPTLTVAHLEAAEIYETKGDFEAAEKSFGTAARQDPSNFSAQFGHGRSLHLLNRIAEAVRSYLMALAIQPNNFDANLALATAYLQIDGPSQALPYAQRSVQINPSSGPARANLGSVYSQLGRHRDAVEQYQAAAELMELSPSLLMNLAESLGKIERYDEMVNTLDLANRLQPSAAAWERIGFANFKMKRFDESMAAFRQAIALDGSHYPALNGLGVCLLNQYLLSNKKDAEALSESMSHFRKSLRINNRQPRIVDLVARYER